MNGDVRKGEPEHRPNGLPAKPVTNHPGGKVSETSHALQNGLHPQSESKPITNGVGRSGISDATASKLLAELKQLPPEIEEIAREYFVSLGPLISHAAQDSWNQLSKLVESDTVQKQIPPAEQPRIAGTTIVPRSNGILPNQTRENLDKKEVLLNFTKEQKDVFIKLLVLLHWSKDVEGISKVIDLNRWLRDRISQYGEVTNDIARMKRYLAFIQLPNPDLKTAAEVLSGQNGTGFSDLGYIPPKPLTNKQALRTLRTLNTLLISRLTLHEDLPPQLQKYCVHDGRVTFYVKDEFELDVSVLSDDFDSQFYLADFRFAFSPAADFPAGQIFDDLASAANEVLGNSGLLSCYQFLHEFTLTYKINLYLKQTQELLQNQWAGNLSVTLIRRTLVVQYWTQRNAPKSWIELGIVRGRKRDLGHPEALKDPYISVRWMRDGKEAEDADIQLDLQHLSMDTLLRQIVAQHSNRVFDVVYDTVIASPMYENGDLRLEQSASSTDPNDCAVEVELAKGSMLKVILEPVTGALVITPTSGLCSQVQADLNRARNVVEDLPRTLLYLRAKTAEDNLSSQAEATGWIVIRSFVPSAVEKTRWFPAHVQRSVFLRCPHWEEGHVVAATHSPQGDRWYLLTRTKSEWTSQEILLPSRHLEQEITREYMRTLQDYCSGMIVLQQNARILNGMSIRNALESRKPVKTDGLELCPITFEYSPEKLGSTLRPELGSTKPEQDVLQLSEDTKLYQRSHIRKQIIVRYLGQTFSSGAILELTGLTADRFADLTILEYLAHTITDPSVTFSPSERRFSIKLVTPVGKPVMEELLGRLLRLETIIAGVNAVNDSPFAAISFLSMDKISLLYQPGTNKDFGVHITFPTTKQRPSIRFTPEYTNPHEFLEQPLSQMLLDPREPLSKTLPTILPLLFSTYPLMAVFQELHSEKWYESFGLAAEPSSEMLLPRIHVMARSVSMFGIQLYAPPDFKPPDPFNPPRTTRMLARFEMLSVTRRGKTRWLLRSAIEEFEHYSQPSYCCEPLKEKLRQEIFKAAEPIGWRPEDSGAVCELNDPKPLVQAVLRVVVSWMRDYRASQTITEPQDSSGAQKIEAAVAKGNSGQATQNQRSKANTSVNQRTGGNRAVQMAPEVITLD